MTGTQIDLASAGQMEKRLSGPMELLQVALQNNAAIDVIERLAALQEKALIRDAEIQFNEAMNSAQSEIGRIAPNATNEETKSKWATYDTLDRVLRPIYIKHGFSLSFTTAECSKAETERILCYVSHRAGHTRTYQKDIPADGRGPKGGAVMTKTHASGAASSYGMRYLLKMIFNIAIGEDDTDGNGAKSEPEMPGIDDWCAAIRDAHNFEEMDQAFREAYSKASGLKSQSAKDALADARNEWRKRKGGTR